MTPLLKFGKISDVKLGRVRVYFEEDNIVSKWLPVLRRRTSTDKESWPLEINEHVVCLVDNNCNNGVCIGAIHNAIDLPDENEINGVFRKTFEDGTVFEYNKKNHELLIQCSGSIIIQGNPKLKIAGDVEIDGKIQGKGDAQFTGTVKSETDILIGSISLKNHIHSGVQPGSGTTSKPM